MKLGSEEPRVEGRSEKKTYGGHGGWMEEEIKTMGARARGLDEAENGI